MRETLRTKPTSPHSFLPLLAVTLVPVSVISSMQAQVASMRVKQVASDQDLNTLKLVLKVQTDAGTSARNDGRSDGKSLSPETAPDEGALDSETTGTFEGCVASWDRGTHMTKNEWRDACKRVNNERSRKPTHD